MKVGVNGRRWNKIIERFARVGLQVITRNVDKVGVDFE